MRIELQPSRVVVNDRLYERPLFGAVAFPGGDSPQGYVGMFGLLARPTVAEAEGLVANLPDMEPFRKVDKKPIDDRWKTRDDVVVELLDEAMCLNLRLLLEKVSDFAWEYRTAHFFCHPHDKDMAFRANGTLAELVLRRQAGVRNPRLDSTPGILPAFLPVGGADAVFDTAIRTAISLEHLLINDNCRNALSQNALAMRALGVGVFQGINYPMTTHHDDAGAMGVSVAESYYGSRGGDI